MEKNLIHKKIFFSLPVFFYFIPERNHQYLQFFKRKVFKYKLFNLKEKN